MHEIHAFLRKKIRLLMGGSQKPAARRSFQWIFYLAASFYFGAVFLRSILVYRNTPDLIWILGMLLVWAALFASEPLVNSRWSSYSPIYVVVQTILIFLLLSRPGYSDFFATLFAILSMQVGLRLSTRIGSVWIVFCALGMALSLASRYKSEAIALVLLNTAGPVFYSAFSRATRRAQDAHAQNQALAQQLAEANQKLQTYATQLEQLAAARERNRLARDLHDSVTQTVFSMTLTTQSASLLLGRDPGRAEAQLDRLSQLARNALAEMQLLITELRPSATARVDLAATLKSYLASERFSENLSVSLEVQGAQSLRPAEEESLFRIIQEALNNTLKHAHTTKAQVRLHLSEPMWIEIQDFGQGFELPKAQQSKRVGLLSMCERAAEIGWDLQIKTSLGHGTCVRVEKLPDCQRQVRQA
jgi:signal transduction histidine kinase